MRINGIGSVELLETADPALAAAVRQRGRRPVVVRTAGQPSVINGIEAVILGEATSGPGSVIRLDSADTALAQAARQRGQRPLVVVDSTGTAVPATAPTIETSYANAGGTGDRTSIITVTAPDGGTAGTISTFVNGALTNAAYLSGFSYTKSLWFDFGASTYKKIDAFKAYHDTAGTLGTTFRMQCSNDGLNWLARGDFDAYGSPTGTEHTLTADNGGYRYYRLMNVGTATASSGPYEWEYEFKINNAPQGTVPLTTPTYDLQGGIGNRTSLITITSTASFTGGTTGLIDGARTTASYMSSGQSGKNIVFDFGVGASKVITEAKWYQDTTQTHGSWKWQGSNDNSAYTDIGAEFTMGGLAQTQTTLSGNTTGYRYYRLLQMSGTTTNPWLYEIEFKIANAS